MTDEQLDSIESELDRWSGLESNFKHQLGWSWANEFHMHITDLIAELRNLRREHDLAVGMVVSTAEAYERVALSRECYRQGLEQIAGIVYNVSMTGERTAAEQRIGEIVFSALNQTPPER